MIQDYQGDPNFVILDVRSPGEYASGYIENAINMCILCSAAFEEELLALDPTLTYLVYCQSGGRSGSASTIMAEVGFTNVYNMLGGLSQWEAEGFPVVEPE